MSRDRERRANCIRYKKIKRRKKEREKEKKKKQKRKENEYTVSRVPLPLITIKRRVNYFVHRSTLFFPSFFVRLTKG